MTNSKYNIIVIVLFLCISFTIIKNIITTRKEGYENLSKQSDDKKYNKFDETIFKVNGKTVDNYKIWKDKNLDQCKEKCDNNKKCIGFTRDRIDDNKKGSCYPITKGKLGDCHSSHKGDKKSREYAMDYDSYLKISYKDNTLISKCLNNSHLDNNYININSHLHPKHYLTIKNNNLRFVKHNIKGVDFHNNSIFKIVKGLEGSGTVSFIVKDNFNENYYIYANDESNYIELMPINENNSSTKERANVSFEVLNGFADNQKISLRKYNLSNNEPELYLILNDKKEPRLVMSFKENINTRHKKEMATFNLINHISNESFLNKTSSKTQNGRQKEDGDDGDGDGDNNKVKEDFVSSIVTLVDNDKNRLNIQSYNEIVSYQKLQSLVNELNKKYETNKISGDIKKEFNLDNVNEILLSNPNNVSCIIYNYDITGNDKEFNKENINNPQQKSFFKKQNVLNYNIENKQNNSKIFKIKSMKIFNYNPKKEFDDKTMSNIYKYDYIKAKIDNLNMNNKGEERTDNIINSFINSKNKQLLQSQNAVLQAEIEIRDKKNKLEAKLNKIYNDTETYKLQKIAKQHILMNSNNIYT